MAKGLGSFDLNQSKPNPPRHYRSILVAIVAPLRLPAPGAASARPRPWLSFGNKGDLTIQVEGDPRLLNRYDVILLNRSKLPEAMREPTRHFADWLTSPEDQAVIGAYEVNGEELFHPSADAPK